jgi:hypothetical protein
MKFRALVYISLGSRHRLKYSVLIAVGAGFVFSSLVLYSYFLDLIVINGVR